MCDIPITHFGPGTAGQAPDTEMIGNKAAGLVELSNLGLSVPPGFVIGTELGRRFTQGQNGLNEKQRAIIADALRRLEDRTDRGFGDDKKPLLVSVRSGAAQSMPGMMDTVLDLGLNKSTVEALARETGDERFAWDSYRRFIQSFSQVVLEIDSEPYEEALEEMRTRCDVETDSELPAEALKETANLFLKIVEGTVLEPFPQDVFLQLNLAIASVFKSWNTPRARRFRDMHSISHEGGTAATIQAMVFGNRDENSCSGVCFTRNPSTGAPELFGEYMPNAQGEDIVSGLRTPMDLTETARIDAGSENTSMEKRLPDAFADLVQSGDTLERHFRDVQEIEFTVESGRLHLLQTRAAKRNGRAALRIAVDLANEGIIDRAEAVSRCGDELLKPMLVARAQPPEGTRPLAKGLPASPGAVSGAIAFSSDAAQEQAAAGRTTILVRPETDPRDVHGMDAASGILTARGGMTSHAAVVARGMGKPCITAAMTMKIDLDARTCTSLGTTLNEGDIVTIDGTTGLVFVGEVPTALPEPEGDLATLLEWRDGS